MLENIIIFGIPIMFSISVHESMHGLCALLLGDDTAYKSGRISLLPWRHVDAIWTMLIPLVMYMIFGFIFMIAKPVQVQSRNLKSIKRDMVLVALAGPISNLLLAILFALFTSISYKYTHESPISLMCNAGVISNIFMFILNILPIPPLDGGNVLFAIIGYKYMYKLRMNGLIWTICTSIFLIFTFGYIAKPVVSIMYTYIMKMFM